MARELTPDAVMEQVERIMSAPWVWGQSDCATSASTVYQALWGIDPIGPVRGTYSDAIGASKLTRNWGGMYRMVETFCLIAGLRPSGAVPGAVGISPEGASKFTESRTALICIQPGVWAGKTHDGFAILNNADGCWINAQDPIDGHLRPLGGAGSGFPGCGRAGSRGGLRGGKLVHG